MSSQQPRILCPICLTITKTDGNPFTSIRSVTLHVVGKAKGLNDHHRAWVSNIVPGFNPKSSINQIGDQIEFYVREEIEELTANPEPQDGQAIPESASIHTDVPEVRPPIELDAYLKAYELIWMIETRLHRFVATVLFEPMGGEWWKGFPTELQNECLQRAQQDDHSSSMDCYINLLDFGDIIKANKGLFVDAFDRLMPEHKDPRAVFHSDLKTVNGLRNSVMHPVRRIPPNQEGMAILERFGEFVRVFVDES